MKTLLFVGLLPILLASCSSKALPLKNVSTNNKVSNVTSSNFDSVWNKCIYFFFDKGYIVKTKDKSAGTFVVLTENAPITNLNKSGSPDNKNALAFTEVRKRQSNLKYIYARKGTIEWNILIQSSGDNKTATFIRMTDKGKMTEIYQDGFTGKRLIKNINLWTTGVFEKSLFDAIK